MNHHIPIPVMFNPLKHHAGYIMQMATIRRQAGIKIIPDDLLPVGENLTDLYIGKLSVMEICNTCLELLSGDSVLTPDTFSKWMSNREYRKVILSDGSEWIVREGKDRERFVHIHPAKYSVSTVRIRSATLKTVILLLANHLLPGESYSGNMEAVNRVRKEISGLSPVKNLDSNKGILKLWLLFAYLINNRDTSSWRIKIKQD